MVRFYQLLDHSQRKGASEIGVGTAGDTPVICARRLATNTSRDFSALARHSVSRVCKFYDDELHGANHADKICAREKTLGETGNMRGPTIVSQFEPIFLSRETTPFISTETGSSDSRGGGIRHGRECTGSEVLKDRSSMIWSH